MIQLPYFVYVRGVKGTSLFTILLPPTRVVLFTERDWRVLSPPPTIIRSTLHRTRPKQTKQKRRIFDLFSHDSYLRGVSVGGCSSEPLYYAIKFIVHRAHW